MCMVNAGTSNPQNTSLAIAGGSQPQRMAPPPSPAAAPIAQPAQITGRPTGLAPGAVASPGMTQPVYGSVSMAKQAQENANGSRIIK